MRDVAEPETAPSPLPSKEQIASLNPPSTLYAAMYWVGAAVAVQIRSLVLCGRSWNDT